MVNRLEFISFLLCIVAAVCAQPFYGCFDWHSAVHGRWIMLLRQFSYISRKY